MRLSKVLSSHAIASRRKADELIAAGRLFVNNKKASLGQLYCPGDKVSLDGQQLNLRHLPNSGHAKVYEPAIVALHKPINTLCSHRDDQGRHLIYDYLPVSKGRPWYCVGRLDFKTTGLILITDCGTTAHKLMHPSSQIQRVYDVKVKPKVAVETLKKISQGVQLDDGWATVSFCKKVSDTESASWIRIGLYEGRNREIRRMLEHFHIDVIRLKRVSYGCIKLDQIEQSGQHKYLSAGDKRKLLEVKKT